MTAPAWGRRDRIAALAWSLDDLLPAAKTASFGGVSGEGPSRRVVCPACNGARVVDVRVRGVVVRREACDTCAGSGRVAEDAYTERRVGTLEQVGDRRRVERVGCAWCQEPARSSWQPTVAHPGGSWVPHSERLDRLPRGCGVRAGVACVACDGTGWRELTLVDVLEPGGVRDGARTESMLDRRAALGSYRELDQAIGRVRRVAPLAARVWVAELVVGVPFEHRRRRQLLAAAWDAVDALMPSRVRVPEDVRVAWLARGERGVAWDVRVRQLVAAGASASEAARTVGVSERRAARAVFGRR